jgi:hypothetical protein
MRVALTPLEAGGTTMVVATSVPTLEAMEQLLEMGMEEGITGRRAGSSRSSADEVRPGRTMRPWRRSGFSLPAATAPA